MEKSNIQFHMFIKLNQRLADQLFHCLWGTGLSPQFNNIGSGESLIELAKKLKQMNTEMSKLEQINEEQKNKLARSNAALAAHARFYANGVNNTGAELPNRFVKKA